MGSGTSSVHYSDEALIAYADGEVRYWSGLVIGRHLRQCWHCRARLAEFERQAGRVAALLRDDPFPPADRLAEARARLLARQRAVDARVAAEARLRAASGARVFSRAARIAASVAAASVVGVAFWMHFATAPAPTRPAPLAVESRPVPEPAPPPRLRMRPPRPAPVDLPSALARRSLASRELDLHLALHRADACTGEPVEIAADEDGSLTVRGVVRDAARREELAAAIASLGVEDVRIELRTIAEAAAGAPAGEFVEGETREFRAAATPFERLTAGTLARERVVAAAHAAVAEAEALLAQAWALRRLEERYPRERQAELDPRERALLRSMAEDHLTLLRAALARLHDGAGEALRPFVASRETAPAAAAGDWFSLARRAAELARQVFAGGEEEQTGAGDVARELLDVLSGMERDWDALAGQVAAWVRDFVGMGEKR